MKILTIKNNNSYSINSLNDFNNYKDEILKSINEVNLEDKEPNIIINDIIKTLFYLHDIIPNNPIDTYIIKKDGIINYCMFVYQSIKKSDKNTIITRLIDNSHQNHYDENNSLNHDNMAVICKIDGQKLYDISKYEIIDIIQNAFICNALLITPDNITNYYYKNNPVYGLNGFDVYNTFKFEDGELMIFLANPDIVIFENNVEFQNKELYKGIFNIWPIFKEKNKIPINIKLLISYHNENVNFPINEEIKEKIINYLSYKEIKNV